MRLLFLLLLLSPACILVRGQKYGDFVTQSPLPEKDYLVIGFLGGRDHWNDERRYVRKLALKLRTMNLAGVHVETVENKERLLAILLIRNALDRNRNGQLDADERASAHLILYGQSFGGAAVVKAARELKEMHVPVLLTIQIDSVGRGDAVIPSNVAQAANLFQRNGLIIRGEPRIRAEDPQKTTIIGNFEFDYRKKKVDLSGVPWHKKLFRTAHAKMEHDPDVWTKVEELILSAIEKELSQRCSDGAKFRRLKEDKLVERPWVARLLHQDG